MKQETINDIYILRQWYKKKEDLLLELIEVNREIMDLNIRLKGAK